MNKLACIAILILGLMLLFTHLAVTFIVGAAPSFVVSTCTAVNNIEGIKQGTMAFGEKFENVYGAILPVPESRAPRGFTRLNLALVASRSAKYCSSVLERTARPFSQNVTR